METVQLGLQADPDNAELQELKTELEEVISLTEATIAELKPPAAPAAPPKRESAVQQQSGVKEKWSRENHPAFKKSMPASATAEENEPQQTFKVNDTVLAKWYSGDKGFYPAQIQSITGSSSNTVYYVKFKNYDTVEKLHPRDMKAINSNKDRDNSRSSNVQYNKRKADGTPVSAPSIPPPPSPSYIPSQSSVISAVADIDPILAQQTKKEPSRVSDGPARPAKLPKKIKANKELEAGKSKWQDFATKGKFGKAGKKESMFRTPEGVNGRGS